MPKLSINIETNYGTLTVQGDSQQEILEALELLSEDFLMQINEKVSLLELKQVEDELKGIIRFTNQGPVIVTRAELSHYENIGLIIYSMKHHEATSKQLRERLEASGKEVIVPARLNEMKKRGHIFKPSGKGSEYKLTAKGLEWVEDEVLEKLRRETD